MKQIFFDRNHLKLYSGLKEAGRVDKYVVAVIISKWFIFCFLGGRDKTLSDRAYKGPARDKTISIGGGH